MAKQTINIGSVPNDGTGSTLRDGGDLINDNFNEIYSAIGDGTTLTAGTFVTTTNTVSITNKTFDTTNTFPTITIGDDTSTNFTLSLGGSFEIVRGSGINTAIDNNRIVLSTDGSIVTETSSDTLTNKNLTDASNSFPTLSIGGLTFDLTDATNYPTSSLTGTITNAQLDGSITNDKLVNNTITIGDDTSTNFNINLGGSFEIVGLTGISTAINNNRIELTVGSVPNGSLPTAATYEGMFAYDTTGQRPYVVDAGGWVRLLDENSSVSSHADVNITDIADGKILRWNSSQARFNVVDLPSSPITVSDDTSTSASLTSLGLVGGSGISTALDPGNNTVTITNTGPSAGFAIAMSIAL